MKTTISVVIPTNRGGPYLDEAVGSIKDQAASVDEVLLVDDGSPEPGLAATAIRLGIRYRRQPASGLSAARNAGVEHTSGEWIAFLDDDDVWHPERIQEQRALIADHPEAVAVFTGGWYMDTTGAPFGGGWPGTRGARAEFLSGAVDLPRITTLLMRRDAYVAVGGCDSRMEPAEDNDLILRLLLRGDLVGVDKPLVGYRRHPSNLTAGRNLRGRQASKRVVTAALRRANAHSDESTARLLRTNLHALAQRAARENVGDFLDAVRARQWREAGRLAAWGMTIPLPSAGAVSARLTNRLSRTTAR